MNYNILIVEKSGSGKSYLRRFFESAARIGRKRNVAFILNTQRAMDVLEGGGVRALLENCAVKVLLRQDESAVGTIGKAFALSESESRRRSKLPAGAPHSRERSCASRVPATKEEHMLFTTKPSEIATVK